MLKLISKKILKLAGWKLDIVLPKEKKFVLIGAPHTSNWDFPLAMLFFWTIDFKIHWVAKVQMFWGPLKSLFISWGGIPINRKSSTGFIEQIAKRFDQSEEMVLCLSPEGTRSKTEYWKSGFYHIAVTANVPICLGYIDHDNKTLGFNQTLHPSGDIDADMEIIAEFYNSIKVVRPDNQGPVRLKKTD